MNAESVRNPFRRRFAVAGKQGGTDAFAVQTLQRLFRLLLQRVIEQEAAGSPAVDRDINAVEIGLLFGEGDAARIEEPAVARQNLRSVDRSAQSHSGQFFDSVRLRRFRKIRSGTRNRLRRRMIRLRFQSNRHCSP